MAFLTGYALGYCYAPTKQYSSQKSIIEGTEGDLGKRAPPQMSKNISVCHFRCVSAARRVV